MFLISISTLIWLETYTLIHFNTLVSGLNAKMSHLKVTSYLKVTTKR